MPIKDISTMIDYIIYITYDLHGQWDYGNQWTTPGFPAGDCLRSHVNRTEDDLDHSRGRNLADQQRRPAAAHPHKHTHAIPWRHSGMDLQARPLSHPAPIR